MIRRILLVALLLAGIVTWSGASQASTRASAPQRPAAQVTGTASAAPDALPDLTIQLRYDRMPDCQWAKVNVIATVRNIGNADSGEFGINVNEIYQYPGNLAPGEVRQYSFPTWTLAANAGTVDPINEVRESNEDNNIAVLQTPTLTPAPNCSPSPTPCPTYTQSPPHRFVEPVRSPTDLLTQDIEVYSLRPQELITVTLESGTFTGRAEASGRARVAVRLLPNVTHHVAVKRLVYGPGGTTCTYGYSLRTTSIDRNGQPLTIVQQPSTPVPAPTCQVRYSIQSQWQDGFVADVTVKNLSAAAISGWTLGWSFAGSQRISNMWSAQPTQSGASVSARNADWNATIAAGGQVNFGFQASYSGSNAKPTVFTLNGAPCLVEGVSTPTPSPSPSPSPTLSPTSLPGNWPDLAIDDFWLQTKLGCYDATTSPMGVRLIVRNAGSADAGPFYVDINGERQYVSAGLAVGQSITLWSGVPSSPNRAVVDPTNLVAESSESNNERAQVFPVPTHPPLCSTLTKTPTRTSTPTAVAGAQPDLAVGWMSIGGNQQCYSPSFRLVFHVSVVNSGSADAGPFVVEANGAQQSVAGLAAGKSIALQFERYIYPGPNSVTVDVTNLVAESNEGNNQVVQMVAIPTQPPHCPSPTPAPLP